LNPNNPETAAESYALELGTTTESKEHPRRERRTPRWLQDYETGTSFSEEEETDMVLFMSNDDPTSYEEASRDEKWREAMKMEMEVIEKKQNMGISNPTSTC